MKREHVDPLELSTLRSALRSVVEEIPDDKLGQRGAMKIVKKKKQRRSKAGLIQCCSGMRFF